MGQISFGDLLTAVVVCRMEQDFGVRLGRTDLVTSSHPTLHENSHHVHSCSLPGPVDDIQDDGCEPHLERTDRPEPPLRMVDEERFVDDTLRGSHTSAAVGRPMIVRVNDEVVHWRKKFLTVVPCNAVGKAFVTELAAHVGQLLWTPVERMNLSC